MGRANLAAWSQPGLAAFFALAYGITWLYNSTGGSLLLPVLFHTASNVSDWIVPLVPFLTGTGSGRAYGLLVLVNTTLAAAVVIACGPQRLARSTAARQKER